MQTTTSETEKKEATSQTNNSTTNPSSSEQQEKSQLDEKSTQKTTETQTSFQKTIKFIPIPPARQKEYDRLKEYFGFDLGKFFGDIFNAMEDYNIDLINDLNHQLLSNYPQQTWIHKSMETVRKNMEQAIATSFDIFELYALQAIFHTPSIKYDHSKTTLPEELKELSEQEQTIHSEIQQLRDRILYEKQLNSKLSEENDRLKKEVKLWEKNKEKLEMISEVCKKEDVSSLKDLMSTLVDYGQQLSERLKNLPTLEDHSNNTDEAPSRKKLKTESHDGDELSSLVNNIMK